MKRLILLALLAVPAFGTARSWTGLGADAKWSTTGNWNPSGALGATDILTFDNTCTNCNSTIDANVIVGAVAFASTYAGTTTSVVQLTIGNGNFTFSGGTLAWTGGTLVFGNNYTTFTCAGNFNTTSGITSVTIAKTSASYLFSLASGCTLTALLSGTQNVIQVNSGGHFVSGESTTTIRGLTIVGTGTFVGPSSALAMSGDLNISGTGSFTMTGGTITFSGNISSTLTCAGNFLSNTGLTSVTLGITNAVQLFTLASSCNLAATISGTTNPIQVTSGATLTFVTSSFTLAGFVNAGTTTAPSGTMTINSNFTNTGTFNHNSGTVAFTDNTSGHTITGSTTFYNFTMATAAAVTTPLTFGAGSTQTIAHNLTLTGISGHLVSLNSSSTPTRWNINAQGTQSVGYVNVKDSNATSNIYAGTNSTNSGNNVNWIFTAQPHGGSYATLL